MSKSTTPTIEAGIAAYEAAAEAQFAPSEVMLSGPEANAISPLAANALMLIQNTEADTQRLVGLIKNFSRGTTAAKTMAGINLRHIREYYYGVRNPNGGRPKKTPNVSAFPTWEAYLSDMFDITRDTGENWMKMADAVQALAEAKGLDLPSICQKLPWDWTPEESAAIDATVHKLTQDKTQRELLQSDFLLSLGYEAPERINGSNNQTGVNGGKKPLATSPEHKVEGQRCLARTALFGHDSKEHRPKPGSPAFWMNALVHAEGKGELHKNPLASLTKKERADIYEFLIQPFVASWKALDS